MQLWGLHLLNLLKLCHAQSPKALRNKHQHVRGFTALTWNWTRHHRKERNSRVTASTQYFPGVKETSIYQHMILSLSWVQTVQTATNCTWEKESNKRIDYRIPLRRTRSWLLPGSQTNINYISYVFKCSTYYKFLNRIIILIKTSCICSYRKLAPVHFVSKAMKTYHTYFYNNQLMSPCIRGSHYIWISHRYLSFHSWIRNSISRDLSALTKNPY